MSENFNTYIEHIDLDTWREICVSNGTLRHFAKGEEFVSIGEVGRYIGFIKSGSFKYTAYSDDGTEHVVGLVFNGGLVVDWRNFLHFNKAKVAIVATTNCDVFCITNKEVKAIIASNPDFHNMVMHTTEAVYGTLYDRHLDLYIKTPKQRYDELVKLHPDLFDLFSLKDIASFLNITPTHLSRLRKKLL